MAGVSDIITKAINTFSNDLALSVLSLIIVLAIVSLFIYSFYKSTSKRNLIELNLKKYNTSEHPFLGKFFAVMLYLVEYIVIMPFLIFLWFAALSFVMLLIVEEGAGVEQVLLISAVLIGAIRILAYIKGEISKDLAKMFPFIALSIFLLTLGRNFNFDSFLTHVYQIPMLLNNIFSYLVVIFFVEIVLRVTYTLVDIWKSDEEEEDDVIGQVVKQKVKEELAKN